MQARQVAEARALCARPGSPFRTSWPSGGAGVNDLKGLRHSDGRPNRHVCPSHTKEMKQFLTVVGQADQAP